MVPRIFFCRIVQLKDVPLVIIYLYQPYCAQWPVVDRAMQPVALQLKVNQQFITR